MTDPKKRSCPQIYRAIPIRRKEALYKKAKKEKENNETQRRLIMQDPKYEISIQRIYGSSYHYASAKDAKDLREKLIEYIDGIDEEEADEISHLEIIIDKIE